MASLSLSLSVSRAGNHNKSDLCKPDAQGRNELNLA